MFKNIWYSHLLIQIIVRFFWALSAAKNHQMKTITSIFSEQNAKINISMGVTEQINGGFMGVGGLF